MAEIRIRTLGDWNHTEIVINGRKLKNLAEFHFSIRGGRKAKMAIKQIDSETHEPVHSSFWGDDFAKMDEGPVENPDKLIHFQEAHDDGEQERGDQGRRDQGRKDHPGSGGRTGAK